MALSWKYEHFRSFSEENIVVDAFTCLEVGEYCNLSISFALQRITSSLFISNRLVNAMSTVYSYRTFIYYFSTS